VPGSFFKQAPLVIKGLVCCFFNSFL